MHDTVQLRSCYAERVMPLHTHLNISKALVLVLASKDAQHRDLDVLNLCAP